MADFKVDRSLLEANSTEEIIRILQQERDDYTPEAIEILKRSFRKDAAERKISALPRQSAAETDSAFQGFKPRASIDPQAWRCSENSERPAQWRLKWELNPQVAQVASEIVMGILRPWNRSS